MTILVTGAAGFIGYHTSHALLQRGESVLGLDNLNAYYDPRLKRARLALLEEDPRFAFLNIDITDHIMVARLAMDEGITDIVHLAAQAGVRHSLTAPFDYSAANVTGHLAMLELARHLPRLRHFVYASSSSVYGGNTKLPFATEDRVDSPISLYAATKRAGELMSHTYSHLYGIPTTGLRFFTVYGPWGRPDMAAYLFASAIVRGEPIQLYNDGEMSRDFTYIDDIVAGILGVVDEPPNGSAAAGVARVYNIGNSRPEPLPRFLALIEAALGRKAVVVRAPLQMGDVPATYADIAPLQALCDFAPRTPIEVGIPKFIEWFRSYHQPDRTLEPAAGLRRGGDFSVAAE